MLGKNSGCRICSISYKQKNDPISLYKIQFRKSSFVNEKLESIEKHFLHYINSKKKKSLSKEYKQLSDFLEHNGIHIGKNPLNDSFK